MARAIHSDHNGYPAVYQDKDVIKDFTIDWTAALGSDTIASSTWTPTGVAVSSSSNTTTKTTVVITGTDGEVTNEITTAGGLKFQRTIKFYERDA